MTILSKKKQNDKRENELDNNSRVNQRPTRTSPPSATSASAATNTNRWVNNAQSSDQLIDTNKNEMNESSNEIQNSGNKRKIHSISSPQQRSVRTRSNNTSPSGQQLDNINTSKSNNSSEDEDDDDGALSSSPINSEDEYDHRYAGDEKTMNLFKDAEKFSELETTFRRTIKEKKGFIIKQMKEDGACLFRAVADQIYGDEEMHSTARNHCMDHIAKNSDYFKQYITEDVERYVSRKRVDTCHGNHIEIIALAEIYNRPIEVYEYSTEPNNTFQSGYLTDNEPIRLSYHGRNHYNSVVDPYKATIGVGLGLPSFIPGLAEKNLMNDAIKTSEEFHIEKQMLDDKLKATDWEATNEEIMELVARESYLQWLKDNEKRQNNQPNPNSISSPMATCSTWDSVNNNKYNFVNNSPKSSNNNNYEEPIGYKQQTVKKIKSPSKQSASTTLITTNQYNSTISNNSVSKSSPNRSPTRNDQLKTNTDLKKNDTNNANGAESYNCYDKNKVIDPNLYEFADQWECQGNDFGDDILAEILAVSQQEYIDSLKRSKEQQQQNDSAVSEDKLDNKDLNKENSF